MEFLIDPSFYAALFGVTLIQLALGADNLIIISILANKLPDTNRKKAINLGLVLAMVFRIILLCMVSLILRYANTPFWHFDTEIAGLHWEGSISGKALILLIGGLFLIWKGVKELRVKAKGHEDDVKEGDNFMQVVLMIAGLNVLFSVDSILTVVGMTDRLSVMIGAVLISVALMLVFAAKISDFISRNPDFEILGLFVLLLIGFVLVLEGGHVAHLAVHESSPSLQVSSEGAGDKGAARLHVDLQGGEAQLYQTALELETETDYVLNFRARSNTAHDLVVHLRSHEPPHHSYGLSTGTVDLSKDYQSFSYSFTSPEATKEGEKKLKGGRLMFWLEPFSAVGDDYFVDQVELVKVGSTENLITNGSFTNGTKSWRAYSEHSSFPYVPQWIVIFILLLMFSVDLYQNWLDKRTAKQVEEDHPIHLHRRKK